MPDPTLMPNPDAGIFRSSDTWVLSGAGFFRRRVLSALAFYLCRVVPVSVPVSVPGLS